MARLKSPTTTAVDISRANKYSRLPEVPTIRAIGFSSSCVERSVAYKIRTYSHVWGGAPVGREGSFGSPGLSRHVGEYLVTLLEPQSRFGDKSLGI